MSEFLLNNFSQMAHLRYESYQVIVGLVISLRDNVVILPGAQRNGKVKTVTYEEAKESAAKLLS